MSGIRIEGNTSGHVAEVDASNNINVTLPLGMATAGFASEAVELDSGGVLGTRTMRALTASIFNRLAVGIDTVLFSDYFNATAQNTGLWRTATTTFTTAFGSSGYNVFNSGAVTTINAATVLQTYRTFSMSGQTPIMFEFSEFRSVVTPANQQAEVGLFLSNLGSTPFTPSDGVYFRMNSSGLSGVLNYNGTETVVSLLTSGQVVVNDNTTYRIVINHYRVEFWGASQTSNPRVLLGVIPVPAANGPPFSALSAPISIRLFNVGTPASGAQLKIANCVVSEMDTNQGTPAADLMAGMGLCAYQGLNGGTMGSSELYTNSLAPGAGAAMTNTTAALGTGLGGQFTTTATLAANTDGIVCSFQNPASTVTATGRTLFITGVKIQSVISAAITGGPLIWLYALAFGHTAVSAATAEGIAAKAPRRIVLGAESIAATAAAGVLGSAGIYMPFRSPVVVNAGEFVAILAKNIGTVASAGTCTFLVTFDGYYD